MAKTPPQPRAADGPVPGIVSPAKFPASHARPPGEPIPGAGAPAPAPAQQAVPAGTAGLPGRQPPHTAAEEPARPRNVSLKVASGQRTLGPEEVEANQRQFALERQHLDRTPKVNRDVQVHAAPPQRTLSEAEVGQRQELLQRAHSVQGVQPFDQAALAADPGGLPGPTAQHQRRPDGGPREGPQRRLARVLAAVPPSLIDHDRDGLPDAFVGRSGRSSAYSNRLNQGGAGFSQLPEPPPGAREANPAHRVTPDGFRSDAIGYRQRVRARLRAEQAAERAHRPSPAELDIHPDAGPLAPCPGQQSSFQADGSQLVSTPQGDPIMRVEAGTLPDAPPPPAAPAAGRTVPTPGGPPREIPAKDPEAKAVVAPTPEPPAAAAPPQTGRFSTSPKSNPEPGK